ncbi:MAG: hypothetical protein VYA55_09735 [Pseudomonadota bacterium]|nr:hypothetical protein [Pseudomonadota bacterium]
MEPRELFDAIKSNYKSNFNSPLIRDLNHINQQHRICHHYYFLTTSTNYRDKIQKNLNITHQREAERILRLIAQAKAQNLNYKKPIPKPSKIPSIKSCKELYEKNLNLVVDHKSKTLSDIKSSNSYQEALALYKRKDRLPFNTLGIDRPERLPNRTDELNFEQYFVGSLSYWYMLSTPHRKFEALPSQREIETISKHARELWKSLESLEPAALRQIIGPVADSLEQTRHRFIFHLRKLCDLPNNPVTEEDLIPPFQRPNMIYPEVNARDKPRAMYIFSLTYTWLRIGQWKLTQNGHPHGDVVTILAQAIYNHLTERAVRRYIRQNIDYVNKPT